MSAAELAQARADALKAAGITLRRMTEGNHRGPCPKCDRGQRDEALGVTISDGGALWHCFRCDWRGAWRPRDPMPERPAPRRKLADRLQPQRRLDLAAWNACLPITPDCPVGRYLTGRRCALPPNDVRWRPARSGGYPEMVALITDAISGEPLSLHSTFIARDGTGKAPVAQARKYLAGHRKAGGVVRLHADDEVTMALAIGEGLETCLTAARELAPAWACLDAGNLAAFPVLPGIEALTVLVDADPAGRRAAAAVRARWEAAEREVLPLEPPVDRMDINDYANLLRAG